MTGVPNLVSSPFQLINEKESWQVIKSIWSVTCGQMSVICYSRRRCGPPCLGRGGRREPPVWLWCPRVCHLDICSLSLPRSSPVKYAQTAPYSHVAQASHLKKYLNLNISRLLCLLVTTTLLWPQRGTPGHRDWSQCLRDGDEWRSVCSVRAGQSCAKRLTGSQLEPDQLAQ